MKQHVIKKAGLLIILAVLFSCKGQNPMVFFSTNNGLSWEDRSDGLPHKVTLGTGALAASGDYLGIATKENGIYLFDFQEDRWVNIPTDKQIIESNLGTLTFFNGQIYIGTQFSGVYSTSDKGNKWIHLKDGLADLTIRKLVPVHNKLYAGTNGGLYAFNEEFKSWEPEYGSSSLQVNGITEFDGNMYIGTNQGVFTKPDGQTEWRMISGNYSIHNISSDDRTIYAMSYNELLSSVDKGYSWQSIQEGLPKELYTFHVISNGNSVFAGQWDGVYRKDHESEPWKSYSKGLPGNLSITNMTLYKDIIVASGNERGLKNGMSTGK